MPVLLGLILLATVGRSSSDSAILERVVREATDRALELGSQIPDPERKLWFMAEAGSDLEGMDDQRATGLLEEAWKLSAGDSKASGDREYIADSVAGINPAQGRALLKELKDDYADRRLARALMYRHPREAARAITSENEEVLFEGVCELCRIRPDIGGKFLRMVKGLDLTQTITSVVANLNKQDGKVFLSYLDFKLPLTAENWQDSHPDASPEETYRASVSMPKPYDRVRLRLEAINGYRKTNPAIARRLADELCAEAQARVGNARTQGIDEWTYWLVPGISMVDTPKVRAYLEWLERKRNVDGMGLVAAWSNLDIDRATRMADSLQNKSPGSPLGPHGQFMDDGYYLFLDNLLRSNPKAAAERLIRLHFTPVAVPEPPDMGTGMIYVQGLISRNWRKCPSQVEEFCSVPAPWQKHFDSPKGSVIDFLKLQDQIRADPKNNFEGLQRLMRDCPDGLFIEDGSRLFTMVRLATDVGRSDVDFAARMCEVMPNVRDRAETLLYVFDALKELPLKSRIKLLDEAMKLAPTDPKPIDCVYTYLFIASQAKQSWRRLQPWPPGRGQPVRLGA